MKHLPPTGARPPKATRVIVNLASEQAPFIYFDGVAAHAVHENNGIVQMELAANYLLCIADGDRLGVRPKVQTVAKLRCSLATLRGLAAVVDQILDGFDRELAKAAGVPDPHAGEGDPASP